MDKLSTAEEGRTNAIISHFTIIGTIIAFLLNNNKKNSFTSFYIRQMIGLHLLSFLNRWLTKQYLSGWISSVIGIIIFLFWLVSFISAINNNEKVVPYIGEKFQEWFKGIQ